jgi:uncharacterized NAD(P)/FAD-binding protein YdhS
LKQEIFSWYAEGMSHPRASLTLPTVAIIGGGFSGTSVAFHLITQATYPLHIIMIERSSRLGKGIAYATQNPFHFLNVPASQMSAWSGHPNDFYDWIKEQPERWHHLHPTFASIPLTPETFLPRCLYGDYLEDLLLFMKKEAIRKQVVFECLHEEAQAIERDCQHHLLIHLKQSKQIAVQAVVLATGVPDTKQLTLAIPPSINYIPDCWNSSHALLSSDSLDHLFPETQVFILGTGLTMVDMAMGLWAKGFQGQIVALSPLGKLPEKHQENVSVYPTFRQKEKTFKSVQLLVKALREEIKSAAAQGYGWRSVIDGLRPQTVELWKQLPLIERRRFLRLTYSIWNKHRHRLAPYCAQLIEDKQRQGKLLLLAGRLKNVTEAKKHSFEITYWDRLLAKNREMKVDYLLNCLGPDYQMSKQSNPLIQQLHVQGVISYDALERGIQTKNHYQVKGVWSSQLYALGALLFGENFETTAVPELREQAHSIAEQLVKTLRVF